MSQFLPQEIIRRKRDGETLSAAEISWFVSSIVDGTIAPSQIGAFTMAVYLKGMTSAERVALTLAMRDTGSVIDWSAVGLGPNSPGRKPVFEKHSSGGVGDEKVTLLVAPLVAACGICCPNISARGLGHTGGELDLLEAIPGYNISPSTELFQRTVRDTGCAIIGPTPDLAPADSPIFYVRDVTATVESIPLITASILSKKLACGVEGMAMTVPFGTGAFMRTIERAQELATSLITVADGAGLPLVALISDLTQVLGDSVGNALEIFEVIDFLTGAYRESRLLQVVLAITAEILVLAYAAHPELGPLDHTAALALAKQKLDDGTALDVFSRMVHSLGGPADLVQRPTRYLAATSIVQPVFAKDAGFIQSMDCYQIGMALVALGAGRTRPDAKIDFAVGISRVAHIGDPVGPVHPLCLLHAHDQESWSRTAAAIRAAVRIGPDSVKTGPVIRERLAIETLETASP